MPVLENWRYELFARSIARGDTPTQAYIGAGYSEKGASGNAAKLLKVDMIASRVDELIRDGIDGQPGIGEIGLAQLLMQDSDVLSGLNFASLSLEWLQKEVFRNLTLARASNNLAAANKALEMMLEISRLQGGSEPEKKRGRGRPRVDKEPNKEGAGDAKSKPEVHLSIINKVIGRLGDVPRDKPDPPAETIIVSSPKGDAGDTGARIERPRDTAFSVDGVEGSAGEAIPVLSGSGCTE
jgi:hypothetical protein